MSTQEELKQEYDNGFKLGKLLGRLETTRDAQERNEELLKTLNETKRILELI